MTIHAVSIVDSSAYSMKGEQYFAGARRDWITQLPDSTSARILEIGCGNGDTGKAARDSGKCGFYAGVELFDIAATEARSKLDDVICGDIESVTLPYQAGSFDVLLISEVLEHLVDPGATLRKVREILKPGAIVFASSPNASHYSIIVMLISGQWRLADKGAMDSTHLRWFTPKSYRELFETAGFQVFSVGPVTKSGWKSRIGTALTLGKGRHLFMRQINLQARKI